ncbi:MAG: hypothetical protein JW822_05120 [Spirochaetales bacterium]|nr:hypothetical protein [Spirochaetales bacterium]
MNKKLNLGFLIMFFITLLFACSDDSATKKDRNQIQPITYRYVCAELGLRMRDAPNLGGNKIRNQRND